MRRCRWVDEKSEIYVKYHDTEWGKPVHDDRTLFEFLLLESFQAGLSWLTVLKKRDAFRLAFDDFDARKVAAYDESKIQELLSNAGIIRSRLKIVHAIGNAKIFLKIQAEFGSFADYLWAFTDGKIIKNTTDEFPTTSALSDAVSKDLKKRGMRYVGSTIIYSYLQAVGIINDHETTCCCY